MNDWVGGMDRQKNHEVDNYLSLKRIVMLSLAITIAYYSPFALSHSFRHSIFPNQEDREMPVDTKEKQAVDPIISEFGTA